MKTLKEIADTWEVQEGDGVNVAVPCNPWLRNGKVGKMLWERYERDVATLPTVYTSLSPGKYKAEDLGEVVWQFQEDDGTWSNSGCSRHNTKLTYAAYKKKMSEPPIVTQTRLFIPAPGKASK